jgi:NSS family neurotransmitter:Na+ symporter
MPQAQESWGSRTGLILAMAGNAVGLGNFLRFPVQAVQNGGGAFIIPYLVSFLLMGIPLLWVEWAMGRFGGKYGCHAAPFILDKFGNHPVWKYFGAVGIFATMGVAAYYLYIESWTLAYTWFSITGNFFGLSETEVSDFFNRYAGLGSGLINFSPAAIFFLLLTLFLNTWILSQGLNKGVERASKIGMPLLLFFGILLAVRAWTLREGTAGTHYDAWLGFNFLWEVKFDSLSDPKIWLAAAGQIFFTLSVGNGSIMCYASYMKSREDIALNAMSAGWLNEFVEIVLGGSIIIPIAVGYMGLDWVKAHAGFMMGFQTMPYLFQQWGPALSAVGGFLWFGLLFFAGITTSLAMGTTWLAFMEQGFHWTRRKSAYSFGLIVLLLAAPCVLFFQAGVFDEYDFWAGTVALVLFGFIEIILFAWVFGIEKGWNTITEGSEINIPIAYRSIIKYITPAFIGLILCSAMLSPENSDWPGAFQVWLSQGHWPLASNSMIGQIWNGHGADQPWFVRGQATRYFITDMARLFLLGIFVILCFLIKKASTRKGLDQV